MVTLFMAHVYTEELRGALRPTPKFFGVSFPNVRPWERGEQGRAGVGSRIDPRPSK